MTLPRPIKALTGLAALVAAMCGAGVVWASVPEPDGTIHACALKIGGLLRVIDPAAGQRCHRQLETPLSWPSGRINFAGPWDPAVTYGEAEVVTLEGSAWIAVESSIGEQPGTGASWAMFAAAGERTEPTARWVPPVRLDDAGFVGDDTSITVGSDGLPFMSYRDLSNVDLKVAHRKDEQCSAAGVISV